MHATRLLHVFLLAMAWRAAPALELAARDATTGAPLHAIVEYTDERGTHALDVDGRLRAIEPPATRVAARAHADGYSDYAFVLDPVAGATTLLLEPLVPPAAFARLARRTHGDARALQGHVRRADDGEPIAGALVSIEGRSAASDAQGYFELELPPFDPSEASRSQLRVDAPGFGEQLRDGLVRAPGVQRLVLALDEAALRRVDHVVGALDREGGVAGAPENDRADGGGPLARPVSPAGPLVAPTLAPPETIRVGYADAACTQPCCTGSCSHSCVLPLETYVRRGLDSEWIASWNTHSLRAGSIAYRSYGAWRVAHPISASFDICSSACCQVNDAGTATSTDAAVARTPGLMLTRGGTEAASAEYSAENNSWDDPSDGLSCSNADLSCGNGFNGSPSTGWPCLADEVGAGHGCFGHGRGMSQWGTQRWAIHASARRWPWIVDHYYNANGAGSGQRTAVMTSPLSLADLAAQPAVAAPGALLQLAARATSAAGAAHAHLLVGASLHRSGVGYLDDPANDAPLSLAPGTHEIGRAFRVPATAGSGRYDLLVSLYLDVDEDGAISSADLPLALATAPQAVALVADRIFADTFDLSH